MGLPTGKTDIVKRTLALASEPEHKLVPLIDPRGPFPFTTEGVREAFRLQRSRHAEGKVVVSVGSE